MSPEIVKGVLMRKFVVLALILGIALIAFAALAATGGHKAQTTASHNAVATSDSSPAHNHPHDANVAHTNHTTHQHEQIAEPREHWGHRILRWLHKLTGTGHLHTHRHTHSATNAETMKGMALPCTRPDTNLTSHEAERHDATPNPPAPIAHPPHR